MRGEEMGLKRIIWHWTAGGHSATDWDRRAYHFLIDGNGTWIEGIHKPEANIRPQPGKYAAHTLRLNTGSIGIALCGMRHANERPFTPGDRPITEAQIETLLYLTATLCDQYRIPISRQTTLSHAEVQPTLGVQQRQKWDIAWLPGMDGPGDPVAIGDSLRARIQPIRRPPSTWAGKIWQRITQRRDDV